MKLAFGSDHAAFLYKEELMEWVKTMDHEVLDFGCFSEESVDYPDFAIPAAESVAAAIADFGIIICGSGIGVSISANKVPMIRAANCCTEELAGLSRQHNNANVLCFGARVVSIDLAKKMITKFLSTDFEGGRHAIRVDKIHSLSSK